MVENRPEVFSQSVFELRGVPNLRQPHPTWCGITSVATVMNYWGHEKTQEAVFENIYYPGVYNASHESTDPVKKPTYEKFALHVKRMTAQTPLAPLTARVIDYPAFERFKAIGYTPRSLLQHFIVDKEIPCIIRVPEHTMVVRGIDFTREKYLVNNPSFGREEKSFEELETGWGSEYDSSYPRDPRYLMMLIYPQTFDKQK